MKKYIKRIIFGIVLFIVIVTVVAVMQYLSSTKSVTFEYSDISKVMVSKINENDTQDIVGTLTQPNSSLRLEKDSSYVVAYTADEGFADGTTTIEVTDDTKTIKLSPYYSTVRLAGMLDTQLAQIHQVIRDSYGPAMSSYDIVRGNLYHKGEWYGTTLVYIGGDPFVSDPLRVVLNKSEGGWKPATQTPEINLNTILYPNIPRDVMSATNVFTTNTEVTDLPE